jgi:hypothetical protein
MRFRTIALVIIAAAVATASALAAPAGKDPMQLILRKADMPAGASYDTSTGMDILTEGKLEAQGVVADAASYQGARYSKARGMLQISGTVYTTTSAANGTKLFSVVKNVRNGFWKTVGGGKAKITVPSYGNQQFARLDPAGSEGVWIMELLVRKNTVVWLLNVKLDRRPAAPKAELLGQVQKYARKQKLRVGSG